jgi:hypothetical protein
MTRCSRFQARLSSQRASLTRHGLLGSNDQIIFIAAFNQCSTDLRCSADKSQKSVAVDHATLPSAGF